MRIEIRSIDGIQESEKDALKLMEASFSRAWLGYAAFEMLQRGGNYEVDLVLVTHERILVVELKKWNGDIRSDGETWYQNEQYMSRTPVKTSQLKAKIMKGMLRKSLGDNSAPYVDSRVVLCGNTKSLQLTADEKPFVHSIEEFLRLADPKAYAREFPQKGGRNPLDQAQKLRAFFMGESFRPKVFSFQNFAQQGEAIFEHPKKVYKEYRAQNKDDPSAAALMRRWNFATLGVSAGTQKDRALVATREQRVLTYVANRDEDAAAMFLSPISSLSTSDVTSEHCELFRLPRKHDRLNNFVNRFEGKLSIEQRVDVLRTVLARFSTLHKLNVAHRDIGDHSIWIERPTSVLLSGFVAAYFPETETVGSLRDQVQASDILLPDDAMDDDKATPFSRDVFLLSVAAHRILFGAEPAIEHGMFAWHPRPTEQDPVGGRLDAWFNQGLAWTASERFPTATEMLRAFNAVDLGLVRAQLIDMEWFNPFQSACRFDRKYPPSESILETESSELYRSDTAEGRFAVKVWWNVRPDEKRPEESLRLLRFLEAAHKIQQSSLVCLSRITDFGISPRGSIFLVREWAEGVTLQDWLSTNPPDLERFGAAADLVTSIARLHELQIFHGDLNLTNIIRRSNSTGGLMFIDAPDLRVSDVVVHTTAYAPGNWEKRPIEHRDRYGATLIAKEILGVAIGSHGDVGAEIARVLEKEGSLSLEPLIEAFEKASQTRATVDEKFVVGVRLLPGTEGPVVSFLSDNRHFHVSIERKQANERVAITIVGVRARLRMMVDPKTLKLNRVFYDPITHQQFLEATRRASFKFKADIDVSVESSEHADDLLEAIRPEVESALRSAPASAGVTNQSVGGGLNVRRIWSTLIRAEAEALSTVTVAAEPYLVPGRESYLFVPYRLEGSSFDFDDEEQVDVLDDERLEDGERRRVGSLALRETTTGVLAVVPRWGNWAPQLGSTLRVRSRAAHQSYEKRKRAVDRVLAGRAIIPDLVQQLEPTDTSPSSVQAREPTDDELDSYNVIGANGEISFSLNDDQRTAFKKLASKGPVGFLQGPPGTGKTAFIATFIHFLLSKTGARRILLVSQSHEAVNNALEKALELAEKTGLSVDAVRIGQEAMLAESVAIHHPNAIQQQYRERFSAQILERLGALAPALGLPSAFVREFAELHLDLGRLVSDIARLTEQQAAAQAEDSDHISQRLNARRETYWEIVEKKYGIARSGSLTEAFATLEGELQNDHRVNSPDAVSRLRQAIGLSREWLEVLGSRTGNFVEFLTRSRAIVAGTCVGIGQWQAQVTSNIYDWVIIDEAGRATPPELAMPMQVGRRVLLVGDHQQLPPFYDDALKEQLGESITEADLDAFLMSDFERMFETAYTRGCAAALQTQYRMAPSIGSMVSQCFYPSRELLPGRGPPAAFYSALPKPLDKEVVWLDTAHLGQAGMETRSDDKTRTSNHSEVKVILSTIRAIINCSAFYRQLKERLKDGEPAIGVICMYADQCKVLERALSQSDWLGGRRRDIKVDTVDSYQGKENRIVIVSLVRNNPRFEQGFLDRPYRTNVAISRAMDRLIIVGSSAMWRNRDYPLGKVVRFIESNRGVLSVDLINSNEITSAEASNEA